uniref:Kazal-like domain-containing protein n=1 Tax=Timema poppense TaxID=170557 RepID=A0A7R9DPU0_TIMPO|nr:unnamed protein product [Timema poppensis]
MCVDSGASGSHTTGIRGPLMKGFGDAKLSPSVSSLMSVGSSESRMPSSGVGDTGGTSSASSSTSIPSSHNSEAREYVSSGGTSGGVRCARLTQLASSATVGIPSSFSEGLAAACQLNKAFSKTTSQQFHVPRSEGIVRRRVLSGKDLQEGLSKRLQACMCVFVCEIDLKVLYEGECCREKTCKKDCPKDYKPVCVYLKVLYEGECCREKTCKKDCPKDYKHVYLKVLYEGECCREKTCKKDCPKDFKPVCAGDGINPPETFCNQCELEVQNCIREKGAV